MLHPDTLDLQLEAIAIAARLRRHGDPDTADLIEQWAESSDLLDQLAEDNQAV